MPDNIGDSLEIEASIDFDALFSNSTSLGIDFGLDFMAGEFGLELPLIGEQNIGPMFEESISIYETAFELFNNTFQLGGFNQETVNFEIGIGIGNLQEDRSEQRGISSRSAELSQLGENSFVSSQTTSERVPEPSSIIGLFTLGVWGVSLSFKNKGNPSNS